ncbi:MAG: hypothetical protein NWF04_06330 [Candidatus Bathyarchaeota archaeon]|nr:hypothetical protein [Candidatus Bathyarchaeota archaeon]
MTDKEKIEKDAKKTGSLVGKGLKKGAQATKSFGKGVKEELEKDKKEKK